MRRHRASVDHFLPRRTSGRLRALAEHPIFLEALGREANLSPDDVLAALDEISTAVLLKFLPEAVSWFRRSEEKEGAVAADRGNLARGP